MSNDFEKIMRGCWANSFEIGTGDKKITVVTLQQLERILKRVLEDDKE